METHRHLSPKTVIILLFTSVLSFTFFACDASKKCLIQGDKEACEKVCNDENHELQDVCCDKVCDNGKNLDACSKSCNLANVNCSDCGAFNCYYPCRNGDAVACEKYEKYEQYMKEMDKQNAAYHARKAEKTNADKIAKAKENPTSCMDAQTCSKAGFDEMNRYYLRVGEKSFESAYEEKSFTNAMTLHFRACSMYNNISSCRAYAQLFSYRLNINDRLDRVFRNDEIKMWLNACDEACDKNDKNKGIFCCIIGLADGEITRTDYIDKIKHKKDVYLKKACDLNNACGCHWLGAFSQDPAEKSIYLQKSCKLGIEFDCNL